MHRYAPDGRLLATVELPVPRPTAVCFAGSTLLITTAWLGLDPAPEGSGRVYAVDVGVSGPAAATWAGTP